MMARNQIRVKPSVKNSPKKIVKCYNTRFKLDLIKNNGNKLRPAEQVRYINKLGKMPTAPWVPSSN